MMARHIASSEFSLTDLALGRLPPEEALKLFEEAESTPEILEGLDLHIAIADLAVSEHNRLFEEGNRRKVFNGYRWMSGVLRDRIRASEPTIVYAMVLLTIALSASAILIWRGLQFEPQYWFASVTPPEVQFRTRALVGRDLVPAATMYSHGRFLEGVWWLERYLREHPAGELSGYVRYSAALGCLVEARISVLGLFPRYDTALARRGVGHLTAVILDSSLVGLEDEARYYRAKGTLMLGDVVGAKRDLELVVARRGTIADPAKILLGELNNIMLGIDQ
jgi:hypothetical protein